MIDFEKALRKKIENLVKDELITRDILLELKKGQNTIEKIDYRLYLKMNEQLIRISESLRIYNTLFSCKYMRKKQKEFDNYIDMTAEALICALSNDDNAPQTNTTEKYLEE